jgi:ribulose-phosphate 3-epimerase
MRDMLDDVLVSPSILSADIGRLDDELASISTADLIHIDVMDGHFVPPVTFGPNVVEAAKAATSVPLDVHVMIDNPDERVQDYLDAGADLLTFHVEAATHAHRIVSRIHASGARAGISLNPGTPVSSLSALIEDVDLVLVMSVDPGYGGQAFIPSSTAKLRELVRLCRDHGVRPTVEVDGGISPSNAAEACRAGATALVAGSAVFGAPDRPAAIAAIREAGRAGIVREA